MLSSVGSWELAIIADENHSEVTQADMQFILHLVMFFVFFKCLVMFADFLPHSMTLSWEL